MAILIMGYTDGLGLQYTPSFYEIGGPVGGDWDYGFDVVIDGTNNIYVSGNSESFGVGTQSTLLFKLKSDDTIEWQKGLSDSGTWPANYLSMDRDSSGNLYVTGRGDAGTADRDQIVAKYDSSGTLLWQRTVGNTSGYEYIGDSVTVDTSGNVWVLGNERNVSTSERRTSVVKFDSSGTALVEKSFRSPSPTSRPINEYEIILDSSNDPYIIGYCAYADFPRTGGVVIKLDGSNGNISWQKDILEGSIGMDVFDGVIDTSGNIYLAGHLNNDAMLIKLDNTGSFTWARTLSEAGSHQWQTVALDSSGNVYVGGWEYAGVRYKTILAKYDSSGNLQWQRIAENSNWNMLPYGMDVNDNYIVVTGSISQERDIYLMRVATDGSGTGAFVGEYTWTYSASSFTSASPNMTTPNASYASITPTYSVSTPTFTEYTGNLSIEAIDY